MLCYFDSEEVNLSHVEEIRSVRPRNRIEARLLNSNFNFKQSTTYDEPGLYVIEVSKHATHWTGKSSVPGSNCVLFEIPTHVIAAVKNKKLRIAIVSIIEGDDYIYEYFDGFAQLTVAMQRLELPTYSVVIIAGNLRLKDRYTHWCSITNNEEKIEIIGGIEWDGKDNNWEIPNRPIVYNSISNKFAKSFNSLNRAHRPHRTEHLFFLAKEQLLDDGIVSGGIWFSEENIKPEHKDILLKSYPRTVDLTVDDLKVPTTIHPSLTSNFSIYENSLLTVVTESHFEQKGLFITEKTFRPMALGHPFIVIGQPFLLKELNSLGFKTNFLDTSYDSVLDNNQRITLVHNQLLEWKKMSYENKINLIGQWLKDVEHNFNHYKFLNFKKIMFDTLIESTKKYFSTNL